MPKEPKKAKEVKVDEVISPEVAPEVLNNGIAGELSDIKIGGKSPELPDNAHSYYVWKDNVFIKFFTNEEFKGEAKKFALAFAEEIGGEVSI